MHFDRIENHLKSAESCIFHENKKLAVVDTHDHIHIRTVDAFVVERRTVCLLTIDRSNLF